MITILFISNDSRVTEMVSRFQTHTKVRLRLALDFDQGLKEVFDNRPAAVFIQSDISGISGETVARHIKSLLRNDAPRMILVQASPHSIQGGKKWFDAVMDLSLPPERLIEQFRQQLSEIAPDQWIETDRGGSAAGEASSHGALSTVESGEGLETFDWEHNAIDSVSSDHQPAGSEPLSTEEGFSGMVPFPSEEAAIDGGKAGLPSDISSPLDELLPIPPVPVEEPVNEQIYVQDETLRQGAESVAHGPQSSETASEPSPPLSVSSPRDGKRDHLFNAPAGSLADFRADTPVNGDSGQSGKPYYDEVRGDSEARRSTLWAVALLVILLAFAGGYFLLGRGGRGEKAPVSSPTLTPNATIPSSSQQPPASPPVQGELPSFIPRSGRDPDYSRANPGWERYQGKGMEFRLFRENGRLQVVQVIAVGGGTISEARLAEMLREMTGSEKYKVSSRGKKGGYSIESGRFSERGEVVIYRKGKTIRGIVFVLG